MISFTYSLLFSTTSSKIFSENLANSTASRPRASISLRCSSLMPRLTPPGRPQLGWTARPPIILIRAWPSRRILSTLPATSMPTFLTTPRMFRSAAGAVGADDEVRPAQGVEVRRVVGGVEDAVEQLAELLGRRRRIDVEHGVQGLGGRHVVGLGADAADAGRQVRHVLGRPAHAELLEAAQLGDLQVGVGHVALRRRGRCRSCRGLPAG